MQNLPIYIDIIFILTTICTLYLFYYSFNKSRIILTISFFWLLIQGFVSFNGFYLKTDTIPPRFIALVLPPLLTIIIFLFTKKSKIFINNIDLSNLILIHSIRIPIEIVLYLLSNFAVIPLLMTFEGRNFDILAGITAPIIYILFRKEIISEKILLIWNIIGLILLLNIVINGILSAPTQFQQFAFDTPNIALLHFPFVWLPCFIVPVVLFLHLISIIKILKNN